MVSSPRHVRQVPVGDMQVIMPRPSTDPLPPRWGRFFGPDCFHQSRSFSRGFSCKTALNSELWTSICPL